MSKTVTLFHFTSHHHLAGCLTDGLRLGGIPVVRNGEFIRINGYQWLTDDPEFDQQTWSRRVMLSEDRSAFRLTVKIPRKAHRFLLRWLNCNWSYPQRNEIAEDLNYRGAGHRPERWWLYRGIIRPEWIVGHCPKKPAPGMALSLLEE